MAKSGREVLKNEGEVIENYEAVGVYDDPFSVSVVEYQAIFFVRANEFDDIDYFLSREAAADAAKDLSSCYQE